MANYANLEAAIQAAVYENATNDITGTALQTVLLQMVSSMGKAGMLCCGVANSNTVPPVSPDSNIFYIAPTGTYSNFGGLTVSAGEWAIFIYNGSWQKQIISVIDIVNDLSTGGADKALSAEQGKTLYGIINGYAWEDVTYTINDNYRIRASDGVVGWNTGYAAIALTPVPAGATKLRMTVAHAAASSFNYGLCFYDNAQAYVSGSGHTYPNTSDTNSVEEVDIPAGAAYFRTCFYKPYGDIVVQAYIRSASYSERLDTLEQEVDALDAKVGSTSLAEMLDILAKYHDFRYVDIMPQTCGSVSPATKIGIFTPISATATTITFSSADAACLDKQLNLVCRTTDGHYYICWFSAADSADTITLLYDFGIGIDLTTVDALMAVHDTVSGGNGQHLSPWGYKAIAEVIAGQTASDKWMANRVASGFTTLNCTESVKNIVRTSDGKTLGTVTYNSDWKNSGRTPIPGGGGQAPFNATWISTLSYRPGGWWTAKRWYIVQGIAGAKMQVTLPAFNRSTKGFVKISCNCPSDGDYNGTAQINILDGDGNVIGTKQIPRFADIVSFDVTDPVDALTVEVEILEDKNTLINIGSIVFYENYSIDYNTIDADSIVAMAGSSNTQYPPSNAAYIGLVAGDPFNVMVVRPDGTTGDGYGYYPKELALVSTATVDNWGKSGEKTAYGLSTIHDIFKTKRYTHIIFSYFGNDLNQGVTYKKIIRNIWEMCEFAHGHGATPVMVMSYGTNSSGQTASYGKLHEYLMLGVSYQYINE